MNLENKLKNIPPIYYINLDHRNDRRDYMESQFKYWNIENYKRISASKYLVSEYENWKQFIYETEIVEAISLMSTHVNHVRTIIDWLDSGVSDMCIIMEDDLCMDNIQYWNFDWNYFVSHLPENWECVQLYFAKNDYIKFFLHKRIDHSCCCGCYLINKSFAEKVKRIMFIDGKYKLKLNDCSYGSKFFPIVCENLLDIGVTYSIPLFHMKDYNSEHRSDGKFGPVEINSSKLIVDWWKNYHHKFSLDDFFTYGKPNDHKMILKVNDEQKIMEYE